MSHRSLTFKIQGVSPLLMHNGRLADPMNEFARSLKAITGKRDKTDADYEEMARVEWYGGMYTDNGKPCIPGEVIEAVLITAAKKTKRGKQVMGGLYCPENALLEFDGPQDLEERWADANSRLTCGCKIGKNRVMRTRPRFNEWALEFTVMYDPHQLNESAIKEIVNTAGEMGLCDWRPKFGRFVVV